MTGKLSRLDDSQRQATFGGVGDSPPAEARTQVALTAREWVALCICADAGAKAMANRAHLAGKDTVAAIVLTDAASALARIDERMRAEAAKN